MEINPLKTKDNQEDFSLSGLQINFIYDLKKKGKSPNTLRNYQTDLNCFKNFILEKKWAKNQKYVEASVIRYYAHFLDKKYTSDNSRRRRLQTLRSFFDYLVSQGKIPQNPVKAIPTSPKFLDIPRPTSFLELKKFWSHLKNELKESNDLNKMIVHRNLMITLLIYKGGLKVSDLATIKKGQIFLGKNTRVMLTPLKRDPYTVPLPHFFMSFYQNYIKCLETEKVKNRIDFEDIFFNANPYKILAGGLSPRGIELIYKEYSEKLKMTITPKSLRQACIFNWLSDKNEESIKEWMGVAPSYSLRPYKELLSENIYSDFFLEES